MVAKERHTSLSYDIVNKIDSYGEFRNLSFNIFNSLFFMYTLEKVNTSLLCILSMLIPQMIPPSYTHVRSYQRPARA